MKLMLSFLIVALFSAGVSANITADNEYLINHRDAVSFKTQAGTLLNQTRNLLVGKYSFAVQGGSSTADISLLRNLSDTKSLAQLPSKAIITNAWLHVVSPVGSLSTSGTIALKVASSGDLLAAGASTVFQTANNFKQLVPTGATTTFIRLGTLSGGATTVKMTLGSQVNSSLTAGKFNVYIEYVLGD